MENFDEYNVALQTAVLNPTKLAFSLPADIAFHKSVDREFAKDIDSTSAKVLSLTNKLLALTANGKGKNRLLENEEDVMDNFHSIVVDAMDQLLERSDICLDEFFGRSKAPAIAVNLQPDTKKARIVPQGRLDPAIQHASHLTKPQLKFKSKPNNDRNFAWQPVLKHKYNAQVPLGHNLQDDAEMPVSIPHPYRYEITHTTYPTRMFQSIPPISPKSFDETPFHWIATSSEFQTLLDKLRKSPEIAVDLEHHGYRSFTGFVCLMQFSTRDEDFVVDTLCLRDELEELNEVFTNPDIVKVFHGAESDIVWLQQNFNLYIVNLFDTFHASKVLEFPRHGLATLLEMYCDFTPDKRFQLADWRIRPLSQEMLSYARSDTHFLLYIYDNLRNALLDRALSRSQSPQPSTSKSDAVEPAHTFVREVLRRSRETALRLYETGVYDAQNGTGPGGWDGLARKWNKVALMASSPDGALAKEVYKCIHDWRDRVSRLEDESTGYVLPNRYLFQLAEAPPADLPALLKLFPSVPPVMKRKAPELLEEIRNSVRRCLSPSKAPAPAPIVEMNTAAVEVPAAPVQVDGMLWVGPSSVPGAAQSSALFGPRAPRVGYATTTSSLFGATSSKPLQIRDTNKTKFDEVKLRIHSTLVVSSSAPIAPLSAVEEVAPAPQLSAFEEQQIEMPFIPASERQKPDTVPMEDDTIVVVGQQTTRKKRKRTKAKPVAEDEDEEEIEAFNYSTAGNILDDNPKDRADGLPRKKQKGAKGSGVFEYGDFPAPPRAYNAPKQGNQSHTFK